jgi:muramoyltetrapeptide carboxypeptidase LdcA involved in peptidoglycan recycling
MADLVKPPRLRPGDTVAIVSLSSGLLGALPHRHEQGRRQLAETFGLSVVDAPNAARSDAWLRPNPAARADDLHWALTNDSVRGIVTAIGGNDSIRLSRYLDLDLIRRHPKVLVGLSDTTMQHLAFRAAGVVSFYGPSLLAGLAENGGIHPYTEQALRRALFDATPYELTAATEWTEEMLDWADRSLAGRRRRYWPNPGWVWLQGEHPVEGRLMGGCIDSLEMAKATPLWPGPNEWRDGIVLLELSQECPPPALVAHWLRNYEAAGILDVIGALLIGRPEDYSQRRTFVLWDTIQQCLAEAGRADLPVVANVDWGHCAPMGVLPLGCSTRVDPILQRISVLESPVA